MLIIARSQVAFTHHAFLPYFLHLPPLLAIGCLRWGGLRGGGVGTGAAAIATAATAGILPTTIWRGLRAMVR